MPTPTMLRRAATTEAPARSIRNLLAMAAACAAMSACSPSQRADEPAPESGAVASAGITDARTWPDVHSYADPDEFVTRHFVLDLSADFDRRQLRGTVTLELERVRPDAAQLVLDTRDLSVETVTAAAGGTDEFVAVPFRLDARDEWLGSALRIDLPREFQRVRIGYATSPEATGLQWLEPSQTAGKRQPFLFSQAQSIHARSFVPLQDTPRIRSTYDAVLRVPAVLTAVMAAESEPGPVLAGSTRAFRFHMPQPIPSYLLALAVGDLAFAATGPRTGVWAEPSIVGAAATEFSDADAMLQKSEALYGPYRWGRYDVLVLPPSFPFGGMENPRLTFMTPTVIAGDKSLVGVLAHELAHSWSGNLVTNATWRDGWLNEGFTTYFERRIMEAVYGKDRARMEWGVGLYDLRLALAELPPEDAWRGALAPDLSRHVGEEGSSVAYEKGALFLYQLEVRFGRDRLDEFLQRWFDDHAFTSVTTPQFVARLRRDLIDRYPGRMDSATVQRWLEDTGLPADAVFVESDAFNRVDAQRAAWERGTLGTGALDTMHWSVQEWLHFLGGVTRPQPVTRLAELDRRYGLTASTNAEIAHAWFRLALASGYGGIDASLERYLVSIGRLKLIRPLYSDLLRTPDGAAFARRVYAEARPGYHAIVRQALDRVMAGEPAAKQVR